MQIGYALSSEEHSAKELVNLATKAENAGFTFAMLSDHFFPWIEAQGESPYAWSVLGAIAQATDTLELGTSVTAPILRYHPLIIAQAAATVAQLMPERFSLGLGTGENLNEHVVGLGWPPIRIRQNMLQEAIDIITTAWKGRLFSYDGIFYQIEDAKIYSLPEKLPPIMIAAGGTKSAEIAGNYGDALITTSTDTKLVQTFENAGGKNKRKIGQIKVCFAHDEATAIKTVMEIWPNGLLQGPLNSELRLPSYFEKASKMIESSDVSKRVVLGNDPEQHLQKIESFSQNGFTDVYVHNIGHDQTGFFTFYEQEIIPKITK